MDRTEFYKYNKRRALFGIISCGLIAAMVFVAMVIRICGIGYVGTDIEGTDVFRMFTVDSNMLVAVCAVLCIPYQIDGYRNRNYHMPRWIMYFLYMGITAVTLTFLLCVFVLGPIKSYKVILFTSSNIAFHLIVPIVAVVSFLFIITDHNIRHKYALITLIPILLYGIVYIVMVFVIGEEKGGWSDVYRFNTYAPWPVMMTGILIVVFLVSALLRYVHNLMHRKQKARTAQLFARAFEGCADIEEAIGAMAEEDRKRDPGNNDITVPRRAIMMLEDKYQSGKTEKELSVIYLKRYVAE